MNVVDDGMYVCVCDDDGANDEENDGSTFRGGSVSRDDNNNHTEQADAARSLQSDWNFAYTKQQTTQSICCFTHDFFR